MYRIFLKIGVLIVTAKTNGLIQQLYGEKMFLNKKSVYILGALCSVSRDRIHKKKKKE